MAITINGNGPGNWNSSGYLGIGTASPTDLLTVEKANGGNYVATFQNTTTATPYGVWIKDPTSATSGYPLLAVGNSAGSSTYLRVDSGTGNVLINNGYGSAAVAYGCRAWVNFNGTGTVAIRASGNVSSITDNSTGDYTVNFTTAMPDANYCAVVPTSPGIGDSLAAGAWFGGVKTVSGVPQTKTVSALRIAMAVYNGPGNLYDTNETNVAIFR